MKKILATIGLVIAILWTLKFVFELSSAVLPIQSKKINTPPLELFGVKLLDNIDKYDDDLSREYKTRSFDDLELVYKEIKDPYLKNIRWIYGDNLALIKNDNFVQYNLYINDKLEIQGIDGVSENFDEDNNFQICLTKKTELINKIVKSYDLDINNFKVQNYVLSNNNNSKEKNNIVSQSFFKFNYDGIDLVYALACGINVDKETSVMWIELLTKKFEVAIYSHDYSKTKKSTEQLLNSDLKGL